MDKDIQITIPRGNRASGTLTFGDGGKGVVSLKVSWSATANESSNSSTVSATMTIVANARGTCLGGSNIVINGSEKSYSGKVLSTSGSSAITHTLVSHSATVPHNSDGTKTITISGKLVWNGYMWNGSSVTFNTLSGSQSVTLDTITVGTAPTNARIYIDRTGVVEGTVNLSTAYDCAKPYGSVTYNFAYSIDGTTWYESGWISSSTASYNITAIARGSTFRFRVKVRNGKGESAWSGQVTAKANSYPSAPTGLYANTSRPINSVALNWSHASDPDGEHLSYKVYISKNNGGWIHIATTSSPYAGYDTSIDAYGTRYIFKVEAYDGHPGIYSTSANSPEFIRATPPASPIVTLNKSGTIEGSVTASGSYSSSFPVGETKYQFAYYYDGIAWQEQAWSSTNSFTINTSAVRGVNWYFRVRVKNDVGTSDWSSAVSVRSNSSPTAPTGLKFSPQYPISTMNLSWTAATDADSQAITYKVYLSKNNGAWSLIATTSSTSYTYDNSQDPYETRYKFKVEAYDTFNIFATSSLSTEFFKPTPPTTPSFSSPVEAIYEYDFSVKWSLSNFFGMKGKYVSEQRVNGGDWTQLMPDSTLTMKTFPIASINRGDTIQFRAKAVNEAGQESAWATSSITKRNRVPSAATNIQPGTGYLLDVINFSWNASVDPDNHPITYILFLKKDQGSYQEIGSTTNANFKWAIPGKDPGETVYRLKIVSEDILGGTSEAIGPEIKKPTPPTKPSNLKPDSGYYEGSINFSWTHSNWYDQTGEYVIEVYSNGVLKKTVSVAHTVSSYTCSLSDIPRGNKVHYRVKAVNSFNQNSGWAESTANMYHNQIPNAPQIVLPLQSSTVHSNKPKIVLKTSIEPDGQSMIMFVKYGTATYNSQNNPEFFSKQTLGNNEYVIFKNVTALPSGQNTIEAYAADSLLVNSSKVTVTINVGSNVSSVAAGGLVTALAYTDRANALNNSRKAYGLQPYNIPSSTKNGDIITAAHINSLVDGITELEAKIDSYHANNKFKYPSAYTKPVKNATTIDAASFNQISNSINSL